MSTRSFDEKDASQENKNNYVTSLDGVQQHTARVIDSQPCHPHATRGVFFLCSWDCQRLFRLHQNIFWSFLFLEREQRDAPITKYNPTVESLRWYQIIQHGFTACNSPISINHMMYIRYTATRNIYNGTWDCYILQEPAHRAESAHQEQVFLIYTSCEHP